MVNLLLIGIDMSSENLITEHLVASKITVVVNAAGGTVLEAMTLSPARDGHGLTNLVFENPMQNSPNNG